MSKPQVIDLSQPGGKDALTRAMGGVVKAGDGAKGNVRPRHTPGEMNKTEAKMDWELELLRRAGHITNYFFEGMKFKLAKKTWYTPDFVIFWADGTLECRECKGHWEDDARAKVKIAAEKFRQFKFTAYKPLKGGTWDVEIINP